MSKRKIYLAYGSNLNIVQMARRCPNAKVLGAAELEDYKLVFRGVADIVPEKGAKTPVGLWSITPTDEKALDVYEGFPRMYGKQIVKVRFAGRMWRVMVYTMNNAHYIQQPSTHYFQTILEGYDDFGLDIASLAQALLESYRK
jgi:hypothetical protein